MKTNTYPSMFPIPENTWSFENPSSHFFLAFVSITRRLMGVALAVTMKESSP